MMQKLRLIGDNKKGGINALLGLGKGLEFREKLNLDKLEKEDGKITIVVDDNVFTITTSFMIGLFRDSLNNFKTIEDFYNKYTFEGNDKYILDTEIKENIKLLFDRKYMYIDFPYSKKPGRPKIDDSKRRCKQYRIRLTKKEFDDLELLSKKYSASKSDIIREALRKFDNEFGGE